MKDKSGHGGPHWEVYKNKRKWKKRERDRDVWDDGRLKGKFKKGKRRRRKN